MQRRTKIICTLGPASNTPEVVRNLIDAGMDIARLNFSHGSHDDHRKLYDLVRNESAKAGKAIAIMQDLQGPKIRVGKVEDDGVLLHKDDEVTLTYRTEGPSDGSRVSISYPSLADDVEVGRSIMIDDGNIELIVTDIEGDDVRTRVRVGGVLKTRKGVNLPHLKNSTPSLTDKDLRDLDFALEMGVDFVALSFVRTAQDVSDLISRVYSSGNRVGVIAKIEKPEAVSSIDQIIAEADGIMVARGDLGIEMALSKVPGTQKLIINKCIGATKPVITATQMLESMTENPRPTRAEASDVANAVMDGTDTVMLSAETAAGQYPVRTVEVMAQIICSAESHRRIYSDGAHFQTQIRRSAKREVRESLARTACNLAEQVGAVAIVSLTNSGATARAIASYRPGVPIYAFTDSEPAVRRFAPVWGTMGFHIPYEGDSDAGIRMVHQALVDRQLARPGDRVVITAGLPLPARGDTNMVHVSKVGSM
ncbi:MAG: pyruvate kinase [Bacteroidota bacterium]